MKAILLIIFLAELAFAGLVLIALARSRNRQNG